MNQLRRNRIFRNNFFRRLPFSVNLCEFWRFCQNCSIDTRHLQKAWANSAHLRRWVKIEHTLVNLNVDVNHLALSICFSRFKSFYFTDYADLALVPRRIKHVYYVNSFLLTINAIRTNAMTPICPLFIFSELSRTNFE